MKIPERLSASHLRLLVPSKTEHVIGDEAYYFSTVTLRTAAKLAPVISTLAGHVAMLLSGDSKRDQGQVLEDYETEAGETIKKTTIEPINPDLAKIRDAQRKAAIEGAVAALLDEKNRLAIGELLIDSLRDDFPRGASQSPQLVKEFVEDMDIPVFVEFLKGLAKANAKVFGDLGKGLGRAVQDRMRDLGVDPIQSATEAEILKMPTAG